jgi:hypothetical protein
MKGLLCEVARRPIRIIDAHENRLKALRPRIRHYAISAWSTLVEP